MDHVVAHAAIIGVCPKGLVIRGTEGMCPVTDVSGTSDCVSRVFVTGNIDISARTNGDMDEVGNEGVVGHRFCVGILGEI